MKLQELVETYIAFKASLGMRYRFDVYIAHGAAIGTEHGGL